MMHPRPAVLYSGGFGHPFEQTSPILASIARDAGWNAAIETDLDTALARLAESDLLIVNALRWSMTQGEKYAPHREQWAAAIRGDQIAAIDRFVGSGGALLVVHTGTICWDTQPQWRVIMGGGWHWGRSHHPPLGPVTVDLTEAGRTLTDGLAGFDLIDEAYHNLDPAPECTVLATVTIDEGPQPIAWTRRHRDGRVAVDALGHDARSLGQPRHRALLHGLFGWLAERWIQGRDETCDRSRD